MTNYDWHFERLFPYWEAFLNGLGNTIALSLALIIFATILGVLVGILLSRPRWWASPLIVLIDILKGLPPLVIILFGYYALTAQVIGTTVPSFWAFVLSLGLNIAAFIADLTRASFTNVPTEYIEMGQSLGLRNDQLIRYVTLPLAIRELIPPLSYLYVETIKLTSLASVINVKETVYAANTVITTLGRSLEVWVVVGLIYLALVMPAMLVARRLERSLKREVGLDSGIRFVGY